MNQYSDSESHDSDEGIRYKTDSTRYKQDKNLSLSRRDRSKSRSKSPRNKFRRRERSRSRSPGNRYKRRDRRKSRSPRNRSRKETRSTSEDLSRNKREGAKPKNPRKCESASSISPQLPTRLKKVKTCVDLSHLESSEGPERRKDDSYLGQLSSNLAKKEGSSQVGSRSSPHAATTDSSPIGPQLPTHLQKKEKPKDSPSQLTQKDNSSYIGPELPPHLLKKEETGEKSSCIGPELPPHIRQKLQEQNSQEEESDDEIYGPLPADTLTQSKAQLALEERALQLKMDQLEPNKDKVPVREDWMLELPDVKRASFGLGPRQFRSKEGPDLSDRSSWTDTPDKKEKKVKVDLKKETEVKEIRKRDEEQEKVAKKHRKKNKESLLEIHQSKMMKKKKEEGPSERRPFNRETDLQVNRFDEAQKKAVLKKAQLLDDRFSSGQSKFL